MPSSRDIHHLLPRYVLQRVYDFDASQDLPAVLLDRLWPRGVAKVRLQGVVWEKDATPSNALRQWLHAGTATRFADFIARFEGELHSDAAQKSLQRIRQLANQHQRLALLTAAKDPAHSHLAVLKQVLMRESEKG